MKQKSKKTAQEMQDDIFRKMPAEKKLKLASDFSMFILRSKYGFSKTRNRVTRNV